MDKMRMESEDITGQNIEKIGALFPNCITEAKDENGKLIKAINFELLKQELSKEVIDGDEAYEFTWVGKKAAIVEANKPIRKTLRPCKEESVNWDTTENLYIEGDNLEVLKLLQESYLNKVKMIYIDPPYNTGNDFIYEDNFSQSSKEYALEAGEISGTGDRLFKNTISNGRFHSDWCSMIYSRLMIAKNLLSNDGLIFISIDDNEESQLKFICDEIFGESNYVNTIIWHYGKMSNESNKLANNHEYVLVYKKTSEGGIFNKVKKEDSEYRNRYLRYITDNNTVIYGDVKNSTDNLILGRIKKIKKTLGKDSLDDNDILFDFNKEFKAHSDTIYHSIIKGNAEENVKEFDMGQKPLGLIKLYMQMALTDSQAIVMDFFSGSATTAEAVMQLNAEDDGKRKFILIQLQEDCPEDSDGYKAGYKNICEIGKERIRQAAQRNRRDYPNSKFDDGFRVFKIDESNMADVYYSADAYDQNMLSQLESNIKPDRTDLDLLFGCLLEWGLPISMPYTSEDIEGCKVHTYNDGDLIACFNENIPNNVIKEIAKRKPLRAVFRDSGFKGSPEKINVRETFKLLSPDTRVKII